jgi:glutathione S-transferase
MTDAILVTIPFSHFCEKARWALDRAGYPYVEEGHPPGFHRPRSKSLGAKGTVPVLRTDAGVLFDDSSTILEHVGEAAALYPSDAALRADIAALEARFDRELGPDVRRIAYFHLLGDARLALPILKSGARTWQRVVMTAMFPLLRALMRRGMRIDAAGVAKSEARLDALIDDLDARLADGRRWLTGDTFTAADLTFASLAAPALRPPEYVARLGSAEDPPGIAAAFGRLRTSRAGELGLRAYREERGRVLGQS